jgi:hypothetical protein
MVMTAKSMGWIEQHRGRPLNMGFEEAPPLPPLNLGFREVDDALPPLNHASPVPPLNLGFREVDDALPPLNLGFQEVDDALPPLNLGFEELPPLNLGFQDVEAPPSPLPPLNLGFEEIVTQERHATSDQSLLPAIRGQHGNLPPLNLGFEELQEDMGFREPVLDVLSRAHDSMDRAVEKLAEFDVEGHPAREWAQTQIQACHQMQVLYRQMVVHRKSRRGVHGMLHMLRTVGPDHVRE